jgi:hypothetical protein
MAAIRKYQPRSRLIWDRTPMTVELVFLGVSGCLSGRERSL